MAENAREGAPQPRVRVGVVRQPVRADHRVREPQHPLHIGLVHRPIDGTRRLQPIDRLLLADAPIGGDRGELAAGLFGGALRPGDQHLQRPRGLRRAQHGRGGDVGIGVEPDLLPRDRRGDQRQGLGGAAEILAGRSSCGARSRPAPRPRGRRQSSLRGCRERRRPRCAYASCRAPRPAAATPPAPRSRRPARATPGHRRARSTGRSRRRRAPPAAARPSAPVRRPRPAGRVPLIAPTRRVEWPTRQAALSAAGDSVEGGEIVGEARVAVIGGVADQIERRRRRLVEQQRRQADPAIAGHDRGDALARLGRHFRGGEQRAVVMGVHVDKAGRDDLARDVDLACARRPGDVADLGDAVAGDRDIGAPTRPAAAVDRPRRRAESNRSSLALSKRHVIPSGQQIRHDDRAGFALVCYFLPSAIAGGRGGAGRVA